MLDFFGLLTEIDAIDMADHEAEDFCIRLVKLELRYKVTDRASRNRTDTHPDLSFRRRLPERIKPRLEPRKAVRWKQVIRDIFSPILVRFSQPLGSLAPLDLPEDERSEFFPASSTVSSIAASMILAA